MDPYYIIKVSEDNLKNMDYVDDCTYACNICDKGDCDELNRGQMPISNCECHPWISPSCPDCHILWQQSDEEIVGKIFHLDILYVAASQDEETPLVIKFDLPYEQVVWSHKEITPELEKEIGSEIMEKNDGLQQFKKCLEDVSGCVEVIGKCKNCTKLWLCSIYTDS